MSAFKFGSLLTSNTSKRPDQQILNQKLTFYYFQNKETSYNLGLKKRKKLKK